MGVGLERPFLSVPGVENVTLPCWYEGSSKSESKAVVAMAGKVFWYSGGGKGGFSSFMMMGVLFVGSKRSSSSS